MELAADSRRGRMQGQRDEKTSGRSRGGSPLAREREIRRGKESREGRKEREQRPAGRRKNELRSEGTRETKTA